MLNTENVWESRKCSESRNFQEYRIPENFQFPNFRIPEAKKFGNGPNLTSSPGLERSYFLPSKDQIITAMYKKAKWRKTSKKGKNFFS